MIKNLKTFDVNELHFNKVYQRVFEQSRCNEIKKSIKTEGYWDHSIIVINTDKEVVDGQHRWFAAKELGVRRITAAVVDFKNKEEEARFFWTINNYKSTHLKPKDYWYARYQSSDNVAHALYALNEFEESLLYKNIQLKNCDTKTRLNISNALCLIIYSCLGWSKNWDRKIDDKLSKEINTIGIKEVVSRSNRIIDFCNKCFGKLSIQNTRPYLYGNFRAILSFHSILDKNGVADKIDTIRKMASFQFTNEFDRTHQSTKVQSLVNYFNSGKSKTKIVYEVYDQPLTQTNKN